MIKKTIRISMYKDDERMGTLVLEVGVGQTFVLNEEFKGKLNHGIWYAVTGYEIEEDK